MPTPAPLHDKVGEVTTTGGTGPYALTGVVDIGWQPFSRRYASGTANIPVKIEDDAGNWTAGWATYTTGSITFTSVIASSKSDDTAVSFAAGTQKRIWVDWSAELATMALAGGVGGGRDFVTATRDYYVSPTGSDSNDGLADTAPFATVQHAADVAGACDVHAAVRINLDGDNGAFVEDVTLYPYLADGWRIKFQSYGAAQAVIQGTVAVIGAGAAYAFDGVTVGELVLSNHAYVYFHGGSRFKSLAGQAYNVTVADGAVFNAAAHTIEGANSLSGGHLSVRPGGVANLYGAVTVNKAGTMPEFATVCGGALDVRDASFTLTEAHITQRYTVYGNGVIDATGHAADFLPGSAAGVALSGGKYLPYADPVRVTAATTFYVATTGSDTTGDGSIGAPWATPHKAVAALAAMQVSADVTISVANGTYTGDSLYLPDIPGTGLVTRDYLMQIVGQSQSGVIFMFSIVQKSPNTLWAVNSLTLGDSWGNVYVTTGILQFNNLTIHADTAIVVEGGALVEAGDFTLTGSNAFGSLLNVITVSPRGFFFCGFNTITVSMTGTVGKFLECDQGRAEFFSATIDYVSGTINQRFDVFNNGVINTHGAGASFLPGTAAGTATTGGQYV